MHTYVLSALILFSLLFSNDRAEKSPAIHTLIASNDHFIERAFTTNEGLPANGVTRVIQDREGYIWATTYNGLVRYNGYEFLIYNTSNIDGLESNRFVYLSQDEEGRILAGLEMNQYVVITDTSATAYTLESEHFSPSDHVTNISVTPKGNLWIGTSSGLFIFDGESYQYQSQLPRDGIHNMIHLDDKSYIIFRRSVYKYNPASGEFSPFLKVDDQGHINSDTFSITQFSEHHTRIADLLVNNEGTFLLSNAALIEIHDEGYQVLLTAEELGQNLFLHIERHSNDYLIAGTHGIHRLTYSDGHFIHPIQIFNSHTNNIIKDHEGSLWASTSSRGLRQFISTPIYLGDRYSFLDDIAVTAILQDIGGTKWFGSNCNGLFRYRDGTVNRFTSEQGILNTCIWSLMEDSDQNLWVGSWGGGLYIKTDQNSHFEPVEIENEQPVNAILSLFQDSLDRVWIGSYFNGLFRIDSQGQTPVQITGPNGNQLSAVRQIYEDSTGTVWVATDRGIGYLEGDSIVKPESLQQLKTRNFRSIMEKDDGTLWFGSYGGGIIIRFPNGEIKTLTTEHGLLDETVSQMNFDHRGHLWLAGNLGVFSVSSSQIDQFLDGQSDEIRISRYGVGEGLTVKETTGGFSPSSLIDQDGKLYIPTVMGLGVIHTGQVSINTTPPKINLESITADSETIHPNDFRSIPHTKQRIVFKTSLLSFKNPEYNRFRYQLTGFDSKWREGTAGQPIEYTQLSPGEYQFIVQGANNDGFWSEEQQLATISIIPPFWTTIPFYLIVSLSLVILGALIYQQKVKQLKERQEELERKVRERTETLQNINRELTRHIDEKNRLHSILAHDLRNPFASIIGYMQLLKEDFNESGNEKEKQIIEALLSAAKNTYNLLENLLQWSTAGQGLLPVKSEFELQEIISEAILMAKIQAEYKNIEIHCHSEDEITMSADRNMILTVIRNIISNAVKFSDENSEIVIRLDSDDDSVTISVKDEGIGMNSEEIEKLFAHDINHQKTGTKGERGLGLGLMLCREFIDLHDGELHVESEPGVGSTFHIILPVHKRVDATAL